MTKLTDKEIAQPSAGTLDRFAEIVGAQYAIRDRLAMASYLTEWRDRYVGKAAMVLRPDTVGQVSEILKLANETGTAIVPQGGNTGLVGGQIPFEGGQEVVLSLSRMNKVLNVDAAGNSMNVEAGVILQDVQRAADEAGRLFPLSLASEGSCQIGGNLATNAGGVSVLAYGNARDLVLGLEVVLADGRIWNGLKGLRKDNSGYDLKNLFIGSEGTLGIITSAVLKLFPKPTQKATAFAGLESLEDVARFFSLVSEMSGPSLTAFELLPRIGVEFVLQHSEGARDPLASPYNWYVLLETSGFGTDEDLAERLGKLLEKALAERLISDASVASSLEQANSFWRLRENMSEVQKAEGGSIKHDVSVPVGMIPDFIAKADALVEGRIPGARPVPFGHFGDGNIHYNVSQPVDMEKDAFLDQWDELNEAVYGLAVSLGGSISAEHGIGRMKRDLLKQVNDPVKIEAMRSLKQALDPNGILNPGKLL